jgi:tRNA G10  N-methylase Trm11
MHLAFSIRELCSLADIEKCRYAFSRYPRHNLITNILKQANTQRESVVWNTESCISYR